VDPEDPLGHVTVSTRILAAVINHEQAELTAATVASFISAVSDPCELLVVDNGSSAAGLSDLRARLLDQVEVLDLPENGGYGSACNAAIREAIRRDADYVWVLNNDLVVRDDPLPALLDVLESDPQVAAAVPVTVDMETGHTVLGAGVDLHIARGRARHRFEGDAVTRLPRDPYETDAVEGACMLIRSSAISSIGGFDEGFFMYWEDTEWSVRARRAGFRLVVVPRARVSHHVSMSSTPIDRMSLILRNRVRFVRACGTTGEQIAFLLYYAALWLPAYTLARLVPRFGLTKGLSVAFGSLAWNVRDARRGGWSLSRRRASIGRFSAATGSRRQRPG
jgi:GT2 family glycosyltransferase